MLQESQDEAMACAQIEYDKGQQENRPAPQPINTDEDAQAF